MDQIDRELGTAFEPKFDDRGLIAAIVVDDCTRAILMFAYMDAVALEKTIATGLAHFHSRSRGRLWLKGETSGNMLDVRELFVDCDQDAIILQVRPRGPACHTGQKSCFYRRVENGSLARVTPPD